VTQELRSELRELLKLLEKLKDEPDLIRDEALHDDMRARIAGVLADLDDVLLDASAEQRAKWMQPLASLYEAARAANAIATAIPTVARVLHEIVELAGS